MILFIPRRFHKEEGWVKGVNFWESPMTIRVVSDRKHVRIAVYNLLGISPDPATGTRVIYKMTQSDIERATADDVFAGNL